MTTRTDRFARDPTRSVERVSRPRPTHSDPDSDNIKDKGIPMAPIPLFHSSWQEQHQVGHSHLSSFPLLILNRDNN
jgi:hypothetical protein